MTSKAKRKTRRSRRKDGPVFEFVDTTVDTFRAGREDEDARLTVRHQAARSGHRESRYSRKDNTMNDAPGPRFFTYPSYHGYEKMRAEFNLDITCLTSFTDIDLPKSAFSQLQRSPSTLSSLIQTSSSSFLTYIPCRYGTWPFLDDAIHCVAARAAHMLGIRTTPLVHLRLYSKALASLRNAIVAQGPYVTSEIYCTTRLLVLYESLGAPDINALAFHNNAGVKFIQQMGPTRNLPAFDRALIRSQISYVITKAIFEKESSLLEAPEWQFFFDHAAKTELNPDSQLVWRFLGAIASLAGVLKDAQVLCEAMPSRTNYLTWSTDILSRVERIHHTLLHSHNLYQQRPPYPSSLYDPPYTAESTHRVRLRGFLLYTMIFVYRIKATFSITEIERAGSEAGAQEVANQALSATRMGQTVDPVMSWHLEERNNLARSVVRTRDQWVSVWEHGKTWEELTSFLLQRLKMWLASWSEESLATELE